MCFRPAAFSLKFCDLFVLSVVLWLKGLIKPLLYRYVLLVYAGKEEIWQKRILMKFSD